MTTLEIMTWIRNYTQRIGVHMITYQCHDKPCQQNRSVEKMAHKGYSYNIHVANGYFTPTNGINYISTWADICSVNPLSNNFKVTKLILRHIISFINRIAKSRFCRVIALWLIGLIVLSRTTLLSWSVCLAREIISQHLLICLSEFSWCVIFAAGKEAIVIAQ